MRIIEPKSWQLQEAKNQLSEVVEQALKTGPQIITRRGVDTAVAHLAGSASVAVGGVGGAPPVTWVFTADPYARGTNIAEAAYYLETGRQLGQDETQRQQL